MKTPHNHKVAIIGGGNMGLAFARALVRGGIVNQSNLLVIDRSLKQKPEIERELKCKVAQSPSSELKNYDVVVLSVKPQDAGVLLASLKGLTIKSQLFISLMTGVSLKRMSAALSNQNIVRAMPNLPARVGQGVTVWKSLKKLTGKQRENVETILNSAGISFEVNKESMMSSATAVTGTGPGYFYYFMEHLLKASKKLGFSAKDSERLILETMRGSLTLWEKSGESVETLRKRVTSKGGTTHAAITRFKKRRLGPAIVEGVLSADKRARGFE
jgi:pyrroline-5-carboxylate reductase